MRCDLGGQKIEPVPACHYDSESYLLSAGKAHCQGSLGADSTVQTLLRDAPVPVWNIH